MLAGEWERGQALRNINIYSQVEREELGMETESDQRCESKARTVFCGLSQKPRKGRISGRDYQQILRGLLR